MAQAHILDRVDSKEWPVFFQLGTITLRYESLEARIAGNTAGIWGLARLTVTSSQKDGIDYIFVEDIVPGGPAHECGAISVGDVLVSLRRLLVHKDNCMHS